jgi:hypothetical protein
MRRLAFIFAVLAVLVPSVRLAAADRVHVRVTARVPLIVAVDGPAQVVLEPGKVVRIHVAVMANVPWVLSVQSPNAYVPETATLSGQPGGLTANSREVEISCAPEATGLQTIELIYTLMPA